MPYSPAAGLKLSIGLVIDGQSVAAGATFTIAYKGLMYALMYKGTGEYSLVWSAQLNYTGTSWERIAPARSAGGLVFLSDGARVRAYNEGAATQYLTVLQLSPLDPVVQPITTVLGNTYILPRGLVTITLVPVTGSLYWKVYPTNMFGASPPDSALMECDGVNLGFYAGASVTFNYLWYIP